MTTSRRQPEMDVYTVRLPRWARPRQHRNPLRPATDHVDRIVTVLAILFALVTAPIAAAAGTTVYDERSRAYALQAQTRQHIAATITDDPVKPDLRRNTVRVTVRWHWAATEHTAMVRGSSTVKPGDRISIWVDDQGSRVGPPGSAGTAMLDAMAVAAATWLAVAVLAAAVVAGVRVRRTRLRDAAWQRDIDRLFGAD